MIKIGIDMFALAAGLGSGSGLPNRALVLNGKPLALNGKFLILGE